MLGVADHKQAARPVGGGGDLVGEGFQHAPLLAAGVLELVQQQVGERGVHAELHLDQQLIERCVGPAGEQRRQPRGHVAVQQHAGLAAERFVAPDKPGHQVVGGGGLAGDAVDELGLGVGNERSVGGAEGVVDRLAAELLRVVGDRLADARVDDGGRVQGVGGGDALLPRAFPADDGLALSGERQVAFKLHDAVRRGAQLGVGGRGSLGQPSPVLGRGRFFVDPRVIVNHPVNRVGDRAGLFVVVQAFEQVEQRGEVGVLRAGAFDEFGDGPCTQAPRGGAVVADHLRVGR